MKRYFLLSVAPDPQTYRPRGPYHWLELPGGGCVAVIQDEGTEPPPGATELPHLLDSKAANFNGVNTASGAYAAAANATGPAPTAIGGIAPTDSTFQLAMKLAKINRHFHP